MNKKHVVIIGGGISGLSSAFFLSQRADREHLPLKITLLEATDRFGGVLRTRAYENLQMEAGADAFYAGSNDTTDLCRELGLQKDMVEAAPCFRRFFGLKNKKILPFPGLSGSLFDAIRFLSSSYLSFSAKCRMLGEPFIPRRKEEGDESLASFTRRRLGQGFYQGFARPLAQSVYMADPERLSMEAVFPKLRQTERFYGSLAGSLLRKTFSEKKEKGLAEFLTLKQGLEGLTQTLVRKLDRCELRRTARVRECVYRADWEISLENNGVLHADSLGLAMNLCDSSKLLSAAAPELSRQLSAIRYDSITVVNLIYRSEDVPAQGSGFLVPMEGKSYPFSSLKWLGKTADGKHTFLRAFLSETMMPGIFCENDQMLKQKILTFLYDAFSVRAQPLFTGVEHYPNAFPQYETGHFKRIVRIEEKIRQYPGLFLTGNGFRGFGITDCIRQARLAVSAFQSHSF